MKRYETMFLSTKGRIFSVVRFLRHRMALLSVCSDSIGLKI